jgi:hypothetical protein
VIGRRLVGGEQRLEDEQHQDQRGNRHRLQQRFLWNPLEPLEVERVPDVHEDGERDGAGDDIGRPPARVVLELLSYAHRVRSPRKQTIAKI